MDDTILRVDDIQKFYGNKGNLTKAVDHISFSVRKGEFLGIMGSSGSGKTTLLNCISTIDTVTSGHIYVEGKDITTLHGSQPVSYTHLVWASTPLRRCAATGWHCAASGSPRRSWIFWV